MAEIIGTWLTQADDEQELPLARCSWRTSVQVPRSTLYSSILRRVFLPDKVHLYQLFTSSGKREMMKHLALQVCVVLGVFARKVIMTETFGFLPNKRPVNFGIFSTYTTRYGRGDILIRNRDRSGFPIVVSHYVEVIVCSNLEFFLRPKTVVR